MNSYEQMIGSLNKLYYEKTTSLPPGIVIYENSWNLEWNNLLAIQRVYEVSKLLNREPDLLGVKSGQSAIWYNPETKVGKGHYHKIEIQDQAYQHTKPARHSDFLFVWLRMKIKPEKAADINKITSSAFYYEPGQLVCAACHFIEASIATFSILKEYNDDKINLDQARQIYDIRIKELLEEFIQSEYTEDIRNYPTPLRDALESYIIADSPSDDIFDGYTESLKSNELVVVNVRSVETRVPPPPEPVLSMVETDSLSVSQDTGEFPFRVIDQIPGVNESHVLSDNDLIREMTMQRIETELIRRGINPKDLISDEPVSYEPSEQPVSYEPSSQPVSYEPPLSYEPGSYEPSSVPLTDIPTELPIIPSRSASRTPPVPSRVAPMPPSPRSPSLSPGPTRISQRQLTRTSMRSLPVTKPDRLQSPQTDRPQSATISHLARQSSRILPGV